MFKNAGGGVAAGVVLGLAYSVFRGLPTGRFVGLFGSGPLISVLILLYFELL